MRKNGMSYAILTYRADLGFMNMLLYEDVFIFNVCHSGTYYTS